MKLKLLTVIICILSLTQLTMGGAKIKVTGIFTNMYYHEEGGDLLGQEIFIIYGGQGNYFASVQCAQGGVRAPFIVKATIENNQIIFNVPDSNKHLCVPGLFIGTISEKGITGEFTGNNLKVTLPRGNSYWQ